METTRNCDWMAHVTFWPTLMIMLIYCLILCNYRTMLRFDQLFYSRIARIRTSADDVFRLHKDLNNFQLQPTRCY